MKASTLLNNIVKQINLHESVNELIKNAHNGDSYSKAVLGISFLNGDYDHIGALTALTWIENFLDEKGPSSKWAIFSEAAGICYFEGIGKKTNNKKSFKFMQQAASFDRGLAMFYLADFFMEGIGTKKDLKQAFKLYQGASGKIKTEPLIYLKMGYLFYWGKGVKKDHKEARKCYEKASKLGSDDASFNLILLMNELGAMDSKTLKLAQSLIDSNYKLKAKLNKILKS